MGDFDSKNFRKTIKRTAEKYSDYVNDLLSTTAFKKPAASLLIKILSIHISTQAFFRKKHEDSYFSSSPKKWARNRLASRAMQDEILYGDDFQDIKKEIEDDLVTSVIENKYRNRIKRMLVAARTKNKIMLSREEDSNDYPGKNAKKLTFNQDFVNYFDGVIKSRKVKQFINSVIPERKISEKIISDIFNELIIILNKKSELSNREIKIAIFLQNLITIYLPNVLLMSGRKNNKPIAFLRKLPKYSKIKYNSICSNCNKRLNKKSSGIYCSNNENRHCYTTRKTKYLLPKKEAALKCNNCRATAKSCITHRIDSILLRFCSNSCYETYRKRVQRSK